MHLSQKQFASAFHYFSLAINWKGNYPNSYMYLAITLNHLNDFQSSCEAFEKALSLEKNDCAIYMNYAIVLYNRGYPHLAKELFKKAEPLYHQLESDEREPELIQ